MTSIDVVLLLLALICFFLAALGVPVHPRVNLTAAGLALWVASLLV